MILRLGLRLFTIFDDDEFFDDEWNQFENILL